MPFTPFHVGPGLLMKPLIGRHFSLTVFILTQLIMDSEPLYYLLRGEAVVHRFFHTYLGASVVAALTMVLAKPLCQKALGYWNRCFVSEVDRRWFGVPTHLPWPAIVISALLGSYSHVFLDSLMHQDMQPWAPFHHDNAWLHRITLEQLYGACLLSGFVGVLAWLYVRYRQLSHTHRKTPRRRVD